MKFRAAAYPRATLLVHFRNPAEELNETTTSFDDEGKEGREGRGGGLRLRGRTLLLRRLPRFAYLFIDPATVRVFALPSSWLPSVLLFGYCCRYPERRGVHPRSATFAPSSASRGKPRKSKRKGVKRRPRIPAWKKKRSHGEYGKRKRRRRWRATSFLSNCRPFRELSSRRSKSSQARLSFAKHSEVSIKRLNEPPPGAAAVFNLPPFSAYCSGISSILLPSRSRHLSFTFQFFIFRLYCLPRNPTPPSTFAGNRLAEEKKPNRLRVLLRRGNFEKEACKLKM